MTKLANLIARFFLKFYKYCISPLLPHVCRFEPSCSSYALECYQRHKFWRASLLTAKRLSRCHPFGGSGHDPVPE